MAETQNLATASIELSTGSSFISIWSLDRYFLLKRFDGIVPIHYMAYCSSNKTLYCSNGLKGSTVNSIYVRNLDTLSNKALSWHTASSTGLLIVRTELQDFLISSSLDGYICVWDTSTNSICKFDNGENKVYDAHEDGVRNFCYCYATNEIISCGYGKQSDSTTLFGSVWDFNSHKRKATLTGQTVSLIGVGVIERGLFSEYITGDELGIFRVYNAVTHTFIEVFLYIL